MKKIIKLAKLNTIINHLEDLKMYREAYDLDKEFIKIAQNLELSDEKLLTRLKYVIAYNPSISDAELMTIIIKICDFMKPERLKDPSKPADSNNVYLRSMPGATPQNSYSDEYWQSCQEATNNLGSYNTNRIDISAIRSIFASRAKILRQAARENVIGTILTIFKPMIARPLDHF
jgi:hypothetical protein